jgi:hypothetical protein
MQRKIGFTPHLGRRPDVIFQPCVKRRKTPFRVSNGLHSIPDNGLKMAFVDFAVLCAKNRRRKKEGKNKAIAILPLRLSLRQ